MIVTPLLFTFNDYCDIIACASREAWLAERRKRIQASEAAAILGVSPWASKMSVYANKTSPPLVEDESTERQSIGLELEAPIRAMYRRKFGGNVEAWTPHAIAVSLAHPYLAATPDALAEDKDRDGRGLLEIKTASEFSQHEWKNDCPLPYQVQVQAGLAVTGLQWGVVAVLIGVSRVERIFIERNDEFIARMLGVLRDFATCLDLRTPPPVDGSEATQRALERLHPADNGKTVLLADGSDAAYEKLLRVKDLMARLKKRKRALENQFREQIGPNTYGVTPQGAWLKWPTQKVREHVVAEHEFRRLYTIKKPPKLIEWARPGQRVEVERDYKVARRKQLPLALKLRLLRQHPRCKWCGCQLTLHTATHEHVVPLDAGGTNDESNIDLACVACNNARGSDAHALEATRY